MSDRQPNHDHDLSLKTAILRAVTEAIEPYEKEVRQLKESAERVARRTEDDRERAREDRERLAKALKEDSQREAEAKAKEIVKDTFKRLGIDTDDPTEFIKQMAWLVEWMNAIGSAKRHTATVLITTIIGGILALMWTAFKGSLLKP